MADDLTVDPTRTTGTTGTGEVEGERDDRLNAQDRDEVKKATNAVGDQQIQSQAIQTVAGASSEPDDFERAVGGAPGPGPKDKATSAKPTPAAPFVVAEQPRGAEPKRDEYTISDAIAVSKHPFVSGAAGGNRHDVTIGDRTISVYSPSAVTEKIDGKLGNIHDVDQIAKAMAAMPDEVRSRITQVNINPGRNPSDQFWATAYNVPNFRSYATAEADGKINIYPTAVSIQQNQLDATLMHETGHILSDQEFGKSGGQFMDKDVSAKWKAWRSAITKDGVSPSTYAKNAPTEDFSETIAKYYTVRGTAEEADLRKQMPARMGIVDQYLRSWAPRSTK